MIIPPLPTIELIPLDEIVEPGPVILVTTPGAWEFAAGGLGRLSIAARINAREASIPYWLTRVGLW